jgi:hypothetical protein
MAITDEYGFRCNARGNRLNTAGHVIAPPRTLPGATVTQNGPGQSCVALSAKQDQAGPRSGQTGG